MQQERVSIAAHFVTLTYDTAHVPITPNGFMSVDKKHVQDFFKRLRFRVSEHSPDVRIKYYLASEYGGRTNRPHYHIILFNVVNPYDVDNTWQLGATHYGQVTGASIGYTLKYLDKTKRIPMNRNDDRIPEFGLMSKGLGLNYILDENGQGKKIVEWHLADLENRMYLNLEGGKKASMPRYYKDKIYSEEQREIIAEKYLSEMRERENKLIAKYGQEELDRLREQEILHKHEKFKNNYKKDKL